MAKRDKRRKRIQAADRRAILRRDKFICGYCGKRKKPSSLVVDHIIPVRYGGHHGMENWVAACWRCNRKKWHYPPREQGAPRLRWHSGKAVARVTWLARGKHFPKRTPNISFKRL